MSIPEELNTANQNSAIPKYYANGFSIGLGTTDITIMMKTNDQPSMVLIMSYNIAKTLVEKLGSLIVEYEDITKTRALTTDQINALFAARQEEEE